MYTIGFIIAAGKQTRFGSAKPKALMEYKGEKIAERSIRILKKKCDFVYVVTSIENDKEFEEAGIENRIVIESGYGCGDAVYKALLDASKRSLAFDSIVCWGDTILDENITESLYFSKFAGTYIPTIPCTEEDDPYVALIPTNERFVDVKFSKFGEKVKRGYHDLSIFINNGDELLEACEAFREKYWDGEKYVHEHGNEFEFLDLYNERLIKGSPIILKTAKSKSFNTIEEFKKL